MLSYAFVGFILTVIEKYSLGLRFAALISGEINGKRAAEPGSVIYIFQHGVSQGRNTDLNVRNQNVEHMTLLSEAGTFAVPRTMGTWTDLATSRMLPETSVQVCYLTGPSVFKIVLDL